MNKNQVLKATEIVNKCYLTKNLTTKICQVNLLGKLKQLEEKIARSRIKNRMQKMNKPTSNLDYKN